MPLSAYTMALDPQEQLRRAMQLYDAGDVHAAFGALRGTLECLRPLTVAIRCCPSRCHGEHPAYLGRERWEGDDAHPGVVDTVTDGVCDACLDAMAQECERRERGAA